MTDTQGINNEKNQSLFVGRKILGARRFLAVCQTVRGIFGAGVEMNIHDIPLRCPKSSRKYFYFNLNNYRNAHYQVLNRTKRWFLEWFLLKKINQKCPKPPLELNYRIWPKRKADLGNIGSVLDKYMEDALVKKGIISDDNVDIVQKISFEFCGYSGRKDGHASLEIKEYRL